MLRKNVAGQFIHFAGVVASTGAALTGATFSYRRCIDGTFAAGGGTITEDTGTGFYKVALAQADTNGNDLGFFFTASTAVPVAINVITTAADPTDSVRLGLTALPNAAAGAAGGLPTDSTGKTSFNDIAATAIVSAGAITTSGGAVSTVTTTTTATNLTNAPTAGDFTATMKTSIGTAVAASAVASVTGNVGGNVVGTVAGVTPSTAAQVAAVLTTQITEAYRANGAAPTLAQFMSETLAHLGEAAISGTTKTIKKLDHTTTAETFTLDDAVTPTSITRST